MLDKYNRKIDYARVSVTNRCNMKCCYCMPDGYIGPSTDILSDDDIINICKSLAKNGITHIKLTGGEPLLRKNLSTLIKKIKNETNIKKVSLTTNGLLLASQLNDLIEAQVDGINISLDAIDSVLYKKITGVDKVYEILNLLEKFELYNFKNIKINCVLINSLNQGEYIKIATLAKKNNISVKFIEMMPIGVGKHYSMYSSSDLKKILEKEFGQLIEVKGNNNSGPATYYTLPNFIGKIGIINAVSGCFCESCNRVRITADGYLKTCLNYNSGVDLKKHLNSSGLNSIIRDIIYNKHEKHNFNQDEFNHETKTMVEIGG